ARESRETAIESARNRRRSRTGSSTDKPRVDAVSRAVERVRRAACLCPASWSCCQPWRSKSGVPNALSFVGGWTVNWRHWNVDQAQVHAQLAAVMDDVAEHEAAKGRRFRHRKNLLTFPLQRPHAGELRVGPVERFARLRSRLFEESQNRRWRFRLCRAGWNARQIDLSQIEDQGAPARKVRDMLCQPAKRSRSVVRLPGQLVPGDALEQLSR